ncbi:MAG: LytTR family DNA-binding domain-containing protein [Aureisphaera sp.]
MNLEVVIIEDEEHSQELLHNLLHHYCPGVKVLGTCDSVIKSIELIKKTKPDLVFIDIELQDGNGFDILKEFPDYSFLTVFITGYDKYMLKAIKHTAFDYILKPFSIEQLRNTVERAKTKKDTYNILKQIENSAESVLVSENKLIVKSSRGSKIITTQDIIYIGYDDPYCEIYLSNNRKVLVHETMKTMLEILPDYFFRIHKSYAINLNKVYEWDNGRGGNAHMCGGISLPISYRNKALFKEKIQQLGLL